MMIFKDKSRHQELASGKIRRTDNATKTIDK